MPPFATKYKQYIENTEKSDNQFGFCPDTLAKIEPLLGFLYQNWWRVDFKGLEFLPKEGAALITGNSNGIVPWPALMLIYAMMSAPTPRKINVVADIDWIEDERLYQFFLGLGFVPWSSANLKRLFAKGELVAVFPEGLMSSAKSFSDRYRVRDFDWSRTLPAIEEGIGIFPLATLGCDESFPTVANLDRFGKLLGLPSFPVTPFFPWYPFPFNLASLPIHWHMRLLKSTPYHADQSRDSIVETAKRQTKFVEGDIQAELNRLLRTRIKPLF